MHDIYNIYWLIVLLLLFTRKDKIIRILFELGIWYESKLILTDLNKAGVYLDINRNIKKIKSFFIFIYSILMNILNNYWIFIQLHLNFYLFIFILQKQFI